MSRAEIVFDHCLLEPYRIADVIPNHASLNFQWQWKLSDTRFRVALEVGCNCILSRRCTRFQQVVDIHCQWVGGRGVSQSDDEPKLWLPFWVSDS